MEPKPAGSSEREDGHLISGTSNLPEGYAHYLIKFPATEDGLYEAVAPGGLSIRDAPARDLIRDEDLARLGGRPEQRLDPREIEEGLLPPPVADLQG